MKKNQPWKKIFVFFSAVSLAAGILGSGCKKMDPIVEPPPPPPPAAAQTITQIVVADANFSLLKAAVVRTKLDAVLSGAGPFTVFAPTDAAFIAAGFKTSADIDAANVDTLKSILLYHAIGKTYKAADIPTASSTPLVTVNGKTTFVTKNSAGVFVNGVPVTKADVLASNGVIHVVGSVLLPPTKNLVGLASANPGLTYLVAAVVRASTGKTNVAAVLSGTGPFTVFAPTNAAFIAAGFPTIASIQAASPDALTAILTAHVIAGTIFSSDLVAGPSPATVNGVKLTIGLTGGATVSGPGNATPAKIDPANVIALNGVVHVIDQVLLPTATISQIVSSGANFTLLKQAVIKSGLAATLSGAGTFTVFAPTDSAFNAAGFKTIADIDAVNPDTLKSIILYHGLAKQYKVADIPTAANTPLASLNGKTLYITKNNSGVYVNGIKVKTADVTASNGVVHVIGSVLLPPTKNIVELAKSNPNLTYLVAAVVRASSGKTNVAAALSGTGPFTVFAPTNAAFIAAGFPTIASIQAASPDALASILTLHVLAARIFSSDLVAGTTPATLNGGTLTISLASGATVKGNGNKTAANIVATNILALNGVVHVVDAVLLP